MLDQSSCVLVLLYSDFVKTGFGWNIISFSIGIGLMGVVAIGKPNIEYTICLSSDNPLWNKGEWTCIYHWESLFWSCHHVAAGLQM